jgi:hypothetical protein
MTTRWQYRVVIGLGLALAVGLGLGLAQERGGPGGAVKGEPAISGPRYTVVETQGYNLIVTDNKTNTLYFYTIDKGADIGADLKLRGSVDLSHVGKAVIRPARVKAKEGGADAPKE